MTVTYGGFSQSQLQSLCWINIFPRYTALSRRYEDSWRSGKRVPFYPCGKVGPETVSTHMEMNQSAQVQIWHQTVPVFDNVI